MKIAGHRAVIWTPGNSKYEAGALTPLLQRLLL
jgi:hypothetical protein